MEQDGDDGNGSDRAKLAGVVIAGKYWLEEYIGSGSTGAVYRARHNVLEKPIALKVLDPELARNAEIVELFKREAKAASRLDHANSVRILDFGADVSGLLYIAMEFAQGPDLLQVLEDEFPLSHARVVAIMSQLLGALAQAHELGVVHRDIKPENVLVLKGTSDDGQPIDVVKVCDFGVAQLSPAIAPALPVPRSGPEHPTVIDAAVLVGTPEYMSPEQARGEPLDARSDVYSAGVVLYQLLTDQVPFTANDVADVAMLQCYAPAPRPSSVRPVDAWLEAICLKAMSKDPQERYQNAREMRAALRHAAAMESADTLIPFSNSYPPPVSAPAGALVRASNAPPLAVRADPDTMKPPLDAPARAHAPGRRPVVALATACLVAPAMAAAVYFWPAGDRREVARALAERTPAAARTALPAAATATSSEVLSRAPAAAAPFDGLALAAVQSATSTLVPAAQPEASSAQPERPGKVDGRSPRPRRTATPAPAATAALPAAVGVDGTTGATLELYAGSATETAADDEILIEMLAEGPHEAEPAVEQPVSAASSEAVTPEIAAPPPTAPAPTAPAAPPANAKAALEKTGPLQASAHIKDVTVRGSLATSVVQRAIDRIRPQLDACYERSAKSAGRNEYGALSVEVELDERGRAHSASAVGGALPGLDRCVADVASRLIARQAPDTGTVKATWQVAFERR
jgi:serine/threonine-protein kinase